MLIEINLLPKEFRPRKVLIKFDLRLVGIMLGIIAYLAMGYWYFSIKEQRDDVASQITKVTKSISEIQEQVNTQVKLIALKDMVKDRSTVIEKLSSGGRIRIQLLKEINDNMPEYLWFNRLEESEEGGSIIFLLEGEALTKTSITEFMRNIQEGDLISRISIESINPSESIGRSPVFLFEISMAIQKTVQPTEKKPTKPGEKRLGS